MNKFLTYIYDESNFLVLFLFHFLVFTLMWYGVGNFISWYMHVPTFWDWKLPNGNFLPLYNRVMLVIAPGIYLALAFTPLMLMKRVFQRMFAKTDEFLKRANELKDKKGLLSLQSDIAEFRKKESWKLNSNHYISLNKTNSIINAKLSMLP